MTGIGIIVIHKALEITYFVRMIGFSKHIMVAAVVITRPNSLPLTFIFKQPLMFAKTIELCLAFKI